MNDLFSEQIAIVDAIIFFGVVYQNWTCLLNPSLLSLLRDHNQHYVY